MRIKQLTGELAGYSIREDGVVFNRFNRPLMYIYSHRGRRLVVLSFKKEGMTRGTLRNVHIDRLMAWAYRGIPLDDNTYDVSYADGDANNVHLHNLLFNKGKL